MQPVGVAELKDQLSRHLRAVEAGAEVEVTDRDRPIAHIVPIRQAGSLAVSSTKLLLQERQGR